MKAGGTDTRQMALDFARPRPSPDATDGPRLEDHARRIAGFLSMALPYAVDVVFHENRRTMISYKRARGRLSVRLHRMFRAAGTEELTSLALFLKGRNPAASKALDTFIAIHREEIVKRAPRAPKPRTSAGTTHDLGPLLERVRGQYFGGLGDVSICWSETRKRRSRRSRSGIRSRALATYSFEDRTIRVSRVLDSARVPEYVLEWVVYHEMLHHVLSLDASPDGRRRFHTRRFRALERAYARYDEARAWEQANLDWLLA